MKKLLFLNDFSADAPQAYRFALEMAAPFQAVVVMAYEDGQSDWRRLLPGGNKVDNLELTLQQFVDEHTPPAFRNLSIDLHAGSLGDMDSILELADTCRADVIAVAGGDSAELPDTTIRLLRKALQPVVVLPSGLSSAVVKRIAFSTNFHFNDLIALNLLCRWCKAYNAYLDVIHVLEDESGRPIAAEKMSALAEVFGGNSMFSFQLLPCLPPRQAILDYAHQQQVDLIALTTHQRTGLRSFLESSTTKFLAKVSDVPLLVIKDFDDARI